MLSSNWWKEIGNIAPIDDVATDSFDTFYVTIARTVRASASISLRKGPRSTARVETSFYDGKWVPPILSFLHDRLESWFRKVGPVHLPGFLWGKVSQYVCLESGNGLGLKSVNCPSSASVKRGRGQMHSVPPHGSFNNVCPKGKREREKERRGLTRPRRQQDWASFQTVPACFLEDG